MAGHPRIHQVAIDAVDIRRTAEFYRELFGLTYRAGDEPPTDGEPDDADWLVLTDGSGDAGGGVVLAFQKVERQPESTWPSQDVPQQLHLDTTVEDAEELERHKQRALALGAKILLDRSDDPEEELYVFADPAGHPFCIFVA